MGATRDLREFSLDAFSGLDLAGSGRVTAKALTRSLEAEIRARIAVMPGPAGLVAMIDALNAVGHQFQPKASNKGWTSFYQSTNDGTRSFHIHVEAGDLPTVMVLYQETIDTVVARRRDAMSPRQRAQADIEDDFSKRGLALNVGKAPYRSMKPHDQLIACLHELEGGVNNGGFDTYVLNTDGARIADAAKFLDEIGAVKTSEIVRDVMALFPGRFGPAFQKSANVLIASKREALEALTNRFYSSRENIAVLAMRYVNGGRKRKNPS